MRRIAICAAVWAGAGCYAYVPSSDGPPAPGAETRVAFHQYQDLPLGELVVRDAASVDGMVHSATHDTLAVSVQWIRSALGERYYANGGLYYVPMDAVSTVSRRTLQPARSAVALAAVVGAGLGVFNFVSEGGAGANTGKPDGPIQPRVVIPIPR